MKFIPPRAISVSCRFAGRNLLDRRRAVFSANSFIASMMAVYIAFQLDLQRPYWAMLTVYLTTQPLAGALRSKALFRFVGTVLGASAAVILVPAFVNEPLLLSLAITGWAGFVSTCRCSTGRRGVTCSCWQDTPPRRLPFRA